MRVDGASGGMPTAKFEVSFGVEGSVKGNDSNLGGFGTDKASPFNFGEDCKCSGSNHNKANNSEGAGGPGSSGSGNPMEELLKMIMEIFKHLFSGGQGGMSGNHGGGM